MPWIRIDDHYDEHPKFARAGPLGVVMWLAGLAYSNRNLTDGFIPWSVARSLVSWEFLRARPDDPEREMMWSVSVGTGMHGEDVDCAYVIEMLLDCGLWDDAPGGYRIHDYGDFQPMKAQIMAERAAKAAAGKAGGLATAAARAAPSAKAKSQPVPNPVPVPTPERENARPLDERWGAPETEALRWLAKHGCDIRPGNGYHQKLVTAVEAHGVNALVGMFDRLAGAGTKHGDVKGYLFGAIDTLNARTRPSLVEIEKTDAAVERSEVRSRRTAIEVWDRRDERYRNTGEWDAAWGDPPKVGGVA